MELTAKVESTVLRLIEAFLGRFVPTSWCYKALCWQREIAHRPGQPIASRPFSRAVAMATAAARRIYQAGATCLGFLVRRAWSSDTLAGVGARTTAGGSELHCLVTRVCKRQTLSEHDTHSLPPDWLSLVSVLFCNPRRGNYRHFLRMQPAYYIISSSQQPRQVGAVLTSVLWSNTRWARLSDLPTPT